MRRTQLTHHRIVILLQARTDSKRLPGKALLPIAGYPMVQLAAMRAQNTGGKLVIVTTSRDTDDNLSSVCHHNGLDVYRGEHQDVRARFVSATSACSGEDIIVRLTADNVLPDGKFIDRMCADFLRSGLTIWGARNYWGLPYGLSAEVLRVQTLRDSIAYGSTEPDREHVTKAIWARTKATTRVNYPGWGRDATALSCSVDSREDYSRVRGLFRGVKNPVSASWISLANRLF